MTVRGQVRRLEALEARTRWQLAAADVAPYAAFLAERDGLPYDDLMIEVATIARQCAGMTLAETVRWVAGEMGVSVADLEAERVADAEAFARWRQAREGGRP